MDYTAAGLAHPPKNAPFESLDELRHVFGMTAAMFEAVRPLITVYSPGTDIDVTAAPEGVLRALRGMDSQRMASLLAARANGQSLSRPTVVMVIVEAETKDGGMFTREAVLRRSNIPARLFDILSWRRRWKTGDAAP